MRDIKIKYYYKNSEGHTISKVFDMDSDIANGDHWDYTSDCPLMKDYKILDRLQYTGLTDKNGVEIYEGDLVEHKRLGVCKVVYDTTEFLLIVVKNNQRCCLRSQFNTVIGNIYQNPELLEGDK